MTMFDRVMEAIKTVPNPTFEEQLSLRVQLQKLKEAGVDPWELLYTWIQFALADHNRVTAIVRESRKDLFGEMTPLTMPTDELKSKLEQLLNEET